MKHWKERVMEMSVKTYMKASSFFRREDGNQTMEVVAYALIIGIMVIAAATTMNGSLRAKFTQILQNINASNSNTGL